jgi:alcohol dehydrogenase
MSSESQVDFGLLRLPNQVSFGPGALDSLPSVARSLGTRVFICADPFLATTALFEAARDAMIDSGLVVEVHTEIVPELPVATVEAAGVIAKAFGPDVVIGFGGGSALDLAKLIALLVAHPGPLVEHYGENNVSGPVVPLIAVPTTAGTGSEVTPVAVVSDPTRELKVGVSSPFLIPKFAIVDPRLTYGAPKSVTAHSGIDAFVHAVESYTSANRVPEWNSQLPVFVGRNALSSLVGLEAAALIGANLRTAVSHPDVLAARDAMAYGSLLAGMAFGGAGTHLSHALQYPVGALSHTPHGLGTGLLLPYVLQACLPETVPELSRLATALGVAGESDPDRARAMIETTRELVADIGIPLTLAEIGISRDQLPRIAELALTVTRLANNSTITASRETFMLILEAAFSGDSSALPQ